MKYKWIALALALLVANVCAQTTNTVATNLVKAPEGASIALAWEDTNDTNDISGFKLYSGTNLVQTFVAPAFQITVVTNGVVTYQCSAPPFSPGTNLLTVAAVNIFTNQSNPSPILGVKILGKPLPPSAPRKL